MVGPAREFNSMPDRLGNLLSNIRQRLKNKYSQETASRQEKEEPGVNPGSAYYRALTPNQQRLYILVRRRRRGDQYAGI
jgi:hypothetical protein